MNMLSRRLLLAAAAVAGLALAGCNTGGASGPAEGDMSMGDPNAPVKMLEYASASCSHCATFNNEVFPAFKAKYIDTGKVHYTLKEFLTPPEQVATAGFLVARCAGKDKYFSVIDAVFHNQAEMFQTGDVRGVLLRIAQSAGLTEEQFNACLTNEAEIKALDERVTRAVREDKITGTPTFVINGKQVASGEVTLAQLDAAVAEAMKK
ncbi:DsbA family protein [Phenylobacterium sp. J367]|nr:DsbA family protein [Phenylobacterium sp. J367]MCR5877421.1 DsbA family protein [Phenylobacterium sp. J367]